MSSESKSSLDFLPSTLNGGSSFFFDDINWVIEDSKDFVLELLDDEPQTSVKEHPEHPKHPVPPAPRNLKKPTKKKYKGPMPKFISNSPEFYCAQCNRAFTTSFAHKRHNAVQHGVISEEKAHFRCNECNRIFFCKDELNRHMIKAHDCRNTVIYCCHLCNRFFPSRYELSRHNVKHHEEKTIPCPVCGDKFSRHFLMRDHMKRNHTRALSAKCKICNDEVRFVDMEEHMAKEHSTKWTCDKCGQVFLKQTIMLEHKLEEHPVLY